MKFQFTDPIWLVLMPLAWGWIFWFALRSDVRLPGWRRWASLAVRTVVAAALVLAIAGLQWLRPVEGMNLFFLLDRSDSVPGAQQDAAATYLFRTAEQKKRVDRAGLIVFGSDASIEFSPNQLVKPQKLQAVVGSDRTDISAAVRLGTAAFPETGQKRLVLISDGNENLGDALAAVMAARPLEVTVDVLPVGTRRGNDVALQKLSLPNNLKKGQTFEVKIFAQADEAQPAKVRLYRNDQYLGEQTVQLTAGKNLFTFQQTLTEPGFYSYDVALEAEKDAIPQNNRASNFVNVRGDPRVLVVSSDPAGDAHLVEALRSVQIDVKQLGSAQMPATLAEMQSYDSIFLSNVAAGDLGRETMKLLESAVRDFGVGLVCIGGDQAFAAGSYRGTPLETALPVSMELSSKKVLPRGALALIMHGMEFNNGNQVARDTALAALDALGPDDEIGVLLWDGTDRWLFPLTRAGNKKDLGRKIAGMNQGDMQSFQHVLEMAHDGLKKSNANLKHIVVFSDGDPGAPSAALMQSIVGDRITVSSVLISGHSAPQTMIQIAAQGNGRFYDVKSPSMLPQIFIKEAAVILKSAIFEDPFTPQVAGGSELIRGIGPKEFPRLLGYVATTPKDRAEVPMVSDKGDPVLAHWQFGLGRAVAFTSDAKAKWARDWLNWGRYRQFWTQIAQWSLRRLENADLATDLTVEKGEGHLGVDAMDAQGNFRNFLNLQAVVVNPKGDRQTLALEQTGPGHYDAKFAMKDVGLYVVRLLEMKDGKPQGTLTLGTSMNYSPEFAASEPNFPLLRKVAEAGGGKLLDPRRPDDNPFLHDRVKTYQPEDWWEWLLKFGIVLFPLDVAIRRIHLDRSEWLKATANLRRLLFFWRPARRPGEAEESLGTLLAKKKQVRAAWDRVEPAPELFRPEKTPVLPAEEKPVIPAARVESPQESAERAAEVKAETTTSRLLEAKRRAQKKK